MKILALAWFSRYVTALPLRGTPAGTASTPRLNQARGTIDISSNHCHHPHRNHLEF